MCIQVCTPGLNILEEMGVLKELVDNNEAHFADSGGFVSPSGLTYIGMFQVSWLAPVALEFSICRTGAQWQGSVQPRGSVILPAIKPAYYASPQQ